jgi:hypothetical protein
MDPNDQHVQANLEIAVFGKQVDQFWNSQIGQYLLERTLEEYNTALEDFKRVNPTDSAAIVKIQGRMWRSESFRDWLSEAITAGLRANDILEGNDDEIS